MNSKRVLFVLILLFMVVYYIARLAVFGMAVSGSGEGFEKEPSELAEAIVTYSFLGIGVLGFLLLPGVVLHKAWGFWGTVVLSAYTVAWDVWAAIWVQTSAAIGIVPAAIIMGYLLLTRKDYLAPRPAAAPAAAS